MLFKEAPINFNPKYETVSCFCENGEEILLLQRQDSKIEGGKWGIPAGKVEPTDQSKNHALVREMREETGWTISVEGLSFIALLYVRYPDHDFIFHMYRTKMKSREGFKLQPGEHKSFVWARPEIALEMDLVMDFSECIKIAFGISKH